MGCCYWFLVLSAALILFLIVLPPPDNKIIGEFQPGQYQNLEELGVPLNMLDNAKYIKTEEIGAEDIEIDSKGFLYTGLHDGSVMKINLETHKQQKIAQFNGQILGLAMSENEQQLALATLEGLALVNLKNYSSRILVSEYNGIKFAALNSITFMGENKLYFTVSGTIPMKIYHKQFLYRLSDGQIFSYEISKNKLELLVENLSLPNGIGYMKEQNCLYVNEPLNHRLLRFQLDSESYMKKSLVMENTIGYFDNLKITKDGCFWIGIPTLRDHVTDLLIKYSIIRKILLNLGIPVEMFIKLVDTSYSGGVKVDPRKREIVEYLFGKPDQIKFVTSINEKNGKIFMSSILSDKIAVLDKAALPLNHAQNIEQNSEEL